MQTVDEILPAFRDGDRSALSVIFRKYYKPLCLFAVKRIGFDDPIIPEMASDAFLQLWNKRKDFYSVKKLESYLFVCVKHDCLDHKRKSARRSAYERFISGEILFNPSEDEDEYFNSLKRFYIALDDLSANQRKVILLFLRGYKRVKIASELHVSIKTVDEHKRRAIEKIRSVLIEKAPA